jgi:hypothetical protein
VNYIYAALLHQFIFLSSTTRFGQIFYHLELMETFVNDNIKLCSTEHCNEVKTINSYNNEAVKGKAVPLHATETLGGRGGIAPTLC